MDSTALRDAYRQFLTAAETEPSLPPAPGEWDARQILGHVALVDAATIAAAAAVAAGSNTTYDNRTCLDDWSIARTIARAGGTAGLRDRIRHQGAALCSMVEALGESELDSCVPALLLTTSRLGPDATAQDTVMVDQPLPLRAIIGGLADDHLPRHAQQLRALQPMTVR